MRTSEFLLEVRRAMGAPNYQARFSDTDVLNIGSSQQVSFVVPQIRALRRDFMTVSKDFTLLTGEDTLALPERAVGRGIRELWFAETLTPTLGDWRTLRQIEIQDLLKLSQATRNVFAYYFENDDLKFYPELPQDSTIRLFYLNRPSNLVLESETATILSVGTDTITLDATPSNIQVGNSIDVVKVKAGYQTLVEDLVVTARSANSITVAGYDFSTKNISVGDILSIARDTSVINLPEDAWDVLVWSTANEMAVALGIDTMIKQTQDQVTANLKGMQQVMAPRSEDPRVILNSQSLYRSGTKRFHSLLR